jgi:glycine betaine/proline transport system permease protein
MTVAAAHPIDARAARVGQANRQLQFWLAIFLLCVLIFALRPYLAWVKAPPPELLLPIADWVNGAADWFVNTFKWLFRAITWLLNWPMRWLQSFLHWLPWPAAILIVAVLAWTAGGARLTAFAVLALLYILVVGYWDESMNTMALVGLSVPMSLAAGLAIGIWAFKSRMVERVVLPTLDVMQTVPTFAYLIPILWLFGFGPVVGLIASMIYATPPMVRNTLLGLQRVQPEMAEAGRMAGCTTRQLLWRVQLPGALSNIMLGVNQTIMAALSMVIIASVIGGFADIGWEVLSTMRKAQFGQSLLSGAVIALIAMVMDRISLGFAMRRPNRLRGESIWRSYRVMWLTLIGCLVLVVIARFAPSLHSYPESWGIRPAEPLNDLSMYLVVHVSDITEWIKDTTLLYILLPLSRGMITVATPKIWGIELTTTVIAGYILLVAGFTALATRKVGWAAGAAIVLFAVVYYFGAINLPWPAVFLVVTALAWQVGGWRLAGFAFGALAFILLSGVWRDAMMSVYLCAVAVGISCLVGIPIGIWAALNDRVSAFLRPINDTLQTMPQFVFLIPVVMLFKVGEFPALMAMVSYAIVPAIRYTEHGIRNVRPDAVEAARAIGCTRWQTLWRVQLPQAVPEIMLGMNQTILFSLAMLVVAALVGTRELGQLVYSALTAGDMGKGLIAGGSMALIAMVADRIVQAWSAQRKAALGLG